jgi:hypothetical protein
MPVVPSSAIATAVRVPPDVTCEEDESNKLTPPKETKADSLKRVKRKYSQLVYKEAKRQPVKAAGSRSIPMTVTEAPDILVVIT